MIYTGNNKNLKIEAYEPCPCHPDKKFKFCCYQKAREDNSFSNHKDSSIGRVNHLLRTEFAKTDFKICFGFDKTECKGPIKGAHTIQNNRILDRLSDNGHLYHFSTEVVKEGRPPEAIIKQVSRNTASTFFGFCDFHDTELFKPIELKEYSGEAIQDFLFAFRSLALELHRKNRMLSIVKKMFLDRPKLMLDEQHVYMYRLAKVDVEDHMFEYNNFKEKYISNQYDILRTVYRKLDYEVKFATSASFAVQHNLNGEMINDTFNLRADRIPSIFVTVYPTKNGTTDILISHLLTDNSVYKSYFDLLETLDNEAFLKYLNYLIIESTENVFFSPSYIEQLSDMERNSLVRSYNSSLNVLERIDLLSSGNYYNFNLFQLAP
ncbi:hypothetical protein [Paenibacillus sp. FSL H3-0310]|uniref:hypothetical protein n=1 Tax=Paenibacillus sp. FSL H3-0310 TaxID=2921429 RepID=UPI0030F58BCF